jgi:hypothetical protein
VLEIAAVIDAPDSTPNALMHAHKANSSVKWKAVEDANRCDENIDPFLADLDAAVESMIQPP